MAIIMDGNGRWAKARGLPRLKGHERGAESARRALKACQEMGVEYLTLYAFSVENWVRPRDEIAGLMKLLEFFLRQNQHELHEHRVRLRIMGRIDNLPDNLAAELKSIEEATAAYTEGTVIVALSYGGRAEIVDATKKICRRVLDGALAVDAIDEETFARYLYLPDLPDPDLMIRTSGEMRISNFLLWQLSYAELYVSEVYWPDFGEEHFRKALEAYANRRRRYGDIQ